MKHSFFCKGRYTGGFCTAQISKEWPQEWIHTSDLPGSVFWASQQCQKIQADGRDLGLGCHEAACPPLVLPCRMHLDFKLLGTSSCRTLSNHSLGIVLVAVYSQKDSAVFFDTVKPSAHFCGGIVCTFIAPGFHLYSLWLVLDFSFPIALNVTLSFYSSNTGQSNNSSHQRWACSVVSGLLWPTSLTWKLQPSIEHSPFPDSLSPRSLVFVCFLLCSAPSCWAWLCAHWFSKAFRPVANFKLRTGWSALLNRDQIIRVLGDKHLLKYFAESGLNTHIKFISKFYPKGAYLSPLTMKGD